MSFCPTCGRWTPDPVTPGMELRLGKCPACKRLHDGADDVALSGSSLGYTVACHRCGLSTGYFRNVEDAIENWNAASGHEEEKE